MSNLTDCTHREKLAWLEQSHLVCQPDRSPGDMKSRRWDGKLSRDRFAAGVWIDSRHRARICHHRLRLRDDSNWGDAMILLPLLLYQTYGDVSLLEEAYDTM